jgi:hypothetical protein
VTVPVPCGTAANEKWPCSSVVVEARNAPFSSLTEAPEITAPDESRTTPSTAILMLAVA